MSSMTKYLNNNMHYVLTSDFDLPYWPFKDIPSTEARRLTFYSDNTPILIWDTYLTDDTRYELNVEVAPDFRNTVWMDLLARLEPGSLGDFSRQKAVWISPIMNDEEEVALINFHKNMTEKNILKTGKIYSLREFNKIIHISDWP